jgi:hypothetical protein
MLADDDLPEINISREACGHPSNPHTVRSPTTLECEGCGAGLAGVLLERMRLSLAGATQGEPMGKAG